MINKILLTAYVLISFVVLGYVLLPNYEFPAMLPDSIQSFEPADVETPLRRGYYTDMTRQEVLNWYENQFKTAPILNLPMPTYLLNYPPEESQTIIRDQARSTFLQEIVHPFRETVFINGYEPAPTDDEHKIVIDGKRYRQKIIVRYVPTNTILRFIISLATLIAVPVLFRLIVQEVVHIWKVIKSKK